MTYPPHDPNQHPLPPQQQPYHYYQPPQQVVIIHPPRRFPTYWHITHFVLSICTGGLWIPFYVTHYVMFNRRNNRNYR